MAAETGDTGRTVDLAHEALISGWPTLQDWVSQRREAEQTRRRLEEKAAEWERLERKGGLLDEAELAEAERWLASPDATELGHGDGLPALVAASRQAIDDARSRELAEARALAAERAATARRLRQRFAWTAALAVLAGIAFVAATVFFVRAGNERDQAERERNNAIAAASTAQAEAEARATAEAEAAANAETSLAQALAAQAQLASGEDETAALLAVQAYLLDGRHQQVTGPIGSALQSSVGSPFFSTQSPEHPSMINTLAASPDGQTFAIARDDGSLQLAQGEAVIDCKPPAGSGNHWTVSLALNKDGTRLAAGGRDGWVRVWRIGSGACLFDHDLPGPGGAITAVAWGASATSPALAAGSCRIETEPVRTTIAPTCPLESGMVRTWPLDPVTGAPRSDQARDFLLGGNKVCALATSPDGRWLAASTCGPTGGEPGSCAAPGAIAFWDLDASDSEPRCLPGHLGAVNALAFRTCGDRPWLVAGSTDRTISLWTTEGDGQFYGGTTLSGPNEGVRSVALSGDCAWLAAGSEDGTTGLWHVAGITSTGMAVEPPPIMILLGTSTQWVRTVAFGGEQGLTLVAESTLGRYRQWDLGFAGVTAPAILPGHTNYIRAMAFSPVPGSLVLASAAEDGTIQVWDPARAAPVTIPVGEETAPFDPLNVTSVAIGMDGTRVAAGDERNTFHLWDITDPDEPALVLEDAITCPINRDVFVAFSPAGDLLATGGCAGVIQLRDPATGALLALEVEAASGRSVTALAFSDDGTMLAAGYLDGTIALWTRTGEGFALRGEAKAHRDRVWSLAFQPGGTRLASGGPEREVMLWQASSQGLTRERALPGHGNEVRSVAFSPDGAFLYSGSRDQTVRIWDTARLAAPPVVILDLAEWVRAIAISSDGSVLAAASDQGTIRLIVPESDALARLACERITRGPLSQAEWDRYVGATLPYQDTCAVLAGQSSEGSSPPVARMHAREAVSAQWRRRACGARDRCLTANQGATPWPMTRTGTTSSSAIATRTRTRPGCARPSCRISRRPA